MAWKQEFCLMGGKEDTPFHGVSSSCGKDGRLSEQCQAITNPEIWTTGEYLECAIVRLLKNQDSLPCGALNKEHGAHPNKHQEDGRTPTDGRSVEQEQHSWWQRPRRKVNGGVLLPCGCIKPRLWSPCEHVCRRDGGSFLHRQASERWSEISPVKRQKDKHEEGISHKLLVEINRMHMLQQFVVLKLTWHT